MKRIIGIIIIIFASASCGDISHRADITPHPIDSKWSIDINGHESAPYYGDTSFACPGSGYVSVMTHKRSGGIYLQIWKIRDGGINGFFLGTEEFIGHDSAVDSGSVATVRWQ